MKWFWIYYGIVNLVCFVAMGADKLCACRGWRRVPEKVLLLLGLPGGGVGGLLGMALFRHKIRKPLFWLVFPLEFVLHLAMLILVFHH